MIRESARNEFELARDERDPLLVMRMILTSREAIQQTRIKMIDKFKKLND